VIIVYSKDCLHKGVGREKASHDPQWSPHASDRSCEGDEIQASISARSNMDESDIP
jgi:hypothetical protein